jgi:Zn-dependent protease with chaperone function
MEKIFAIVEELTENLKKYASVKLESAKLNAAEKSSVLVSNAIAMMVVALVFILFFFFASIALAIFLGVWLNKLWLGFILVALFYLIIGILVWWFRQKIIQLPLMNALLKQLIKTEDEEN